jgi:hypothetical protein
MAEETAAAPKIKTRKPKQRACDEKDEKGKLCAGHLKRWYDYPKEVAAVIGAKAEIYRCEFCKTLYRPDPAQQPQSYTFSKDRNASKRMDLRLEYGHSTADSSRHAGDAG